MSNCEICKLNFPVGSEVYWNPNSHKIRCSVDLNGLPHTFNQNKEFELAGIRARTKGLRLFENRKANVFEKNPKWSPVRDIRLFILEIGPDSLNWLKGQTGELETSNILRDYIDGETSYLLNDRKLPKSSGNIDHLAINSSGVFVIDAKNWTGKIESKNMKSKNGGFLVLKINNYRNSTAIKSIQKQVLSVQNSMDQLPKPLEVFGIISFLENAKSTFNFAPVSDRIMCVSSKDLIHALIGKNNYSKYEVLQALKVLDRTFVSVSNLNHDLSTTNFDSRFDEIRGLFFLFIPFSFVLALINTNSWIYFSELFLVFVPLSIFVGFKIFLRSRRMQQFLAASICGSIALGSGLIINTII